MTATSFLQGAAVLAASMAAAGVLLAPERRSRGWAMLGALVLTALGLATIVARTVIDEASGRPVLLLAATGAGALGLAVLVLAIRRWSSALPLLVIVALPFRVPVTVGETTANLLLPLYVVIAAGAVAYALGWVVRRDEDPPRDRRVLALQRVLAAVLVLYALQALYSTDVEQALKNVCFFYVPFTVLFALLADLEWPGRLLRALLCVVTGLAVAFAAVGFVEYATGHLLIANPKVIAANELKPYFRVNSLFFDPNIYGRFLALTMVLLAAALLWTTRRRLTWLTTAALTLLWAGLVLSLSQSSYAALLVGLAVLAALRWRPGPVIAAGAAAVAVAVVVAALAPGSVGLKDERKDVLDLDKASSGRLALVEGAVSMARDRPVHGFGSGSFAERYRTRERIRSPKRAAISHTIPLTIAAEQGAIGLVGYAALLWTAFALLFSGVRSALRTQLGTEAVARAVIAAAFAALVLHTLAYAAFLEDPLAWTFLGIAVALSGVRGRRARATEVPTAAGEAAEPVAVGS